MENELLLEIKNLHVIFNPGKKREFHAIRGIDLTIRKNEIIGIVGESGSGKSVTMTSVIGLLPEKTEIRAERMDFMGRDLSAFKKKDYQSIRGNHISMIFQDPMTTLNPVFTIENQLVETIRAHRDVSKKEARRIAVEMLKLVGIPEPERRIKMYPHEFSGGMRQRVMIAIALVCEPELLIADEPTTALDVTVQKQILELLKKLQHEKGTSIVMITHDLGVIWETCERLVVMFKGHVVESGTVRQIYDNPCHPYTKGLLRSQINTQTMGMEYLPTIEYGAFTEDVKSTEPLTGREVEPGHWVADYTKDEEVARGNE